MQMHICSSPNLIQKYIQSNKTESIVMAIALIVVVVVVVVMNGSEDIVLGQQMRGFEDL